MSGALCGIGMAAGTKGKAGMHGGMVATIIALLSIVGGKYATAYLLTQQYSSTTKLSEAEARAFFTGRVEAEMKEKGETLSEPTGRQTFSPEASAEADRQWQKMTEDQRDAFAREQAAMANAGAALHGSSLTMDIFTASFTPFSLIFCATAAYTAFRLGASTRTAS